MYGSLISNGHRWSAGEKKAGRSSLEIIPPGRRTGRWMPWIGRFWQLRENRRQLPRFIPSLTSRSTFAFPISISTIRFILLCSLWYMSSAMSSNTGKAILNQFRYPVTLTFVQFGFVAGYCLVFMNPVIRVSRFRRPTRTIIKSTIPMAMFQVGGHIFSSFAIARIPVSTVHTIKALSPLFTVAAYALLFRVRYSVKTYVSLVPLTVGVMLACSADVSASNFLGVLSAFGSAIVFVSSNIVFKRMMPSPSASGGLSPSGNHKLDKLNLLFYSSGLAFILMIPIWVYSDLRALNSPLVAHPPHPSSHSVAYYFFWNGTVHFGQNIIAFAILATTSPVTYSIASLIKRIAVIIIAIAWFNQTVYSIQACGIALTSMGLWLYNGAKDDVDRGEKKMLRVEADRQLILPSTEGERRIMGPAVEVEEKLSGRARRSTVSTSVHQNHTQLSPTLSSHAPPSIALPYAPPSLYSYPNPPMYSYRPIPVALPMRSYPSPPPSLDSPPHHTAAFHADIGLQRIPQVA